MPDEVQPNLQWYYADNSGVGGVIVECVGRRTVITLPNDVTIVATGSVTMTSRDRTATWRPRGRGRRNGTGPRALHARNVLYVPGWTGNRRRQNDGGTSVSEIRTPEASSNYDADADVEAEANPNASATPAVNEPDNHYQVQTQPSEASTSSTAVATSWTGSTTDDEGLQPNHVQASSATPLADVVPEQIVSTNNGVSSPGLDGRSADTALIELSPEVSRSHGSQHH